MTCFHSYFDCTQTNTHPSFQPLNVQLWRLQDTVQSSWPTTTTSDLLLHIVVTMDLSYLVLREDFVSHLVSGLGDHLVAMVKQSYCFCLHIKGYVLKFFFDVLYRNAHQHSFHWSPNHVIRGREKELQRFAVWTAAELRFTHTDIIDHQTKGLIQLYYAWMIINHQTKLHIDLNQLTNFCRRGTSQSIQS